MASTHHLSDLGIDVHRFAALGIPQIPAGSGESKLVALYCDQEEKQRSALLRAVVDKKADDVEWLLERSEDGLNCAQLGDGMTALHWSAMTGQLGLVTSLRKTYRARLDVQLEKLGYSPLALAVATRVFHEPGSVSKDTIQEMRDLTRERSLACQLCGTMGAVEIYCARCTHGKLCTQCDYRQHVEIFIRQPNFPIHMHIRYGLGECACASLMLEWLAHCGCAADADLGKNQLKVIKFLLRQGLLPDCVAAAGSV